MATGPANDWRQLLQQAVDRHQRGLLGEAIGLYRAVLTAQPDNADALHLMGMALEQAGRPEQGLAFVELAIRQDPGLAAFHNTLGSIRRALSDQAGARAAYAEALRLAPDDPEISNNLGLLAQAEQDWDAARAHFQRVLQSRPDYGAARFNLAVTDWQAGRRDAALVGLRDVLAAEPAYAPRVAKLAKRSVSARDLEGVAALAEVLEPFEIKSADRNLLHGAVALLRGETASAEAALRSALAVNPDHVESLGLLGRSLLDRQAYADALPILERLQALQPDNPATIAPLAHALVRSGQQQRAVPLLRRLCELQPEAPGHWTDLAQALSKQNSLDEAAAAYHRAIELAPQHAEFHANLAGIEIRRGDLAAAEQACGEALRLDPVSRTARGNLANILGLQKRFDEAETIYAALLAEFPEDGTSHNNLGIMRLRQGRYAEGWPHFAWRSKSVGWTSPDRSLGLPQWDGLDLPPGRLLVWGEQGVGDEILFSSLLSELAASGVDIVLSTDARLVPLLGRSFPGIQVVANETIPAPASLGIVCQRALGDLGSLLRPDGVSFERQPSAYLKADTDLRDRLRRRYRAAAAPDDLLVGLAWNSSNVINANSKSIPLAEMASLTARPGLQAVSLQYGPAAAEIERLRTETGIAVLHDPEIDPLVSIDDQAAQIAGLDFVVTISTAAAHLAAALGLPVLILVPDERGILWYWGHEGERTPWYGSVRICRSQPGETVLALIDRAKPMVAEMAAQVRQKRSR